MHLVKITNIKHLDCDGNILWEANDLNNMLHTSGQAFILDAMFLGGNSPNTYIPNNYYFGLDSRSAIVAADTMTTINGVEPSVNGYSRQSVASSGQFTISVVGGINQANSPTITFIATGGSWGPIKNLFLTNKSDYSGALIASVYLNQTLSLTSGQSISLKMALSLQDNG